MCVGSITLDGKELLGSSVRQVLDSGVGFVPEDRQDDGLVGEFSIAENLILDLYKKAPYSRRGTMNRAVDRQERVDKVAEFDVRAQSSQDAADTLSGGNQQKVVLARELARPLKLFIASQPTRGVDVGSIEFLHKRIVAERDAGTPVVIVSTELDEVLELADRIAVLFAGRLMGIVPGKSSRALLGLMMAGLTAEEAQEQMDSQQDPAQTGRQRLKGCSHERGGHKQACRGIRRHPEQRPEHQPPAGPKPGRTRRQGKQRHPAGA